MVNETVLTTLLAVVTAILSFGVVLLVYRCCRATRKKKNRKKVRAGDEDDEVDEVAGSLLDEFSTFEESPSRFRSDLKVLKKHAVSPNTRQSPRSVRLGLMKMNSETCVTSARNVQPRVTRHTPLHSSASSSYDDDQSVQDESDATRPALRDGDKQAFDTLQTLGTLQFTITYTRRDKTLSLGVLGVLDTSPIVGELYVKAAVLPDRECEQVIKVNRTSINTTTSDVFTFQGCSQGKLAASTLQLLLFDYDRYSRDEPVGEILVQLSDLDLSKQHALSRSINPIQGHSGKLGELLFSLCYQPDVGRMSVVVIKARQLRPRDNRATLDPYVKIWLVCNGKKIDKKQTAIKKGSTSPVFNESFILNVSSDRIRDTSLLVCVLDHGSLGRSGLVGKVLLTTRGGPVEVKHWTEALEKPRQTIAQWHILKLASPS